MRRGGGRRGERRRLTAGAALFGAVALAAAVGLSRADGPGSGASFRLQASDGRIVTESSFEGRLLLLYFGYAHCRDVCPATLARVAEAMDRLGAGADRVQPLFVTVDPVQDTPAALAAWLRGFSPRLLGLTGSREALAPVWRRYGVRGGAPEHSAALYLVGSRGAVQALPPDLSAEALDAAIRARLRA
jgi:cytochrome oxidase Cu insertion factor (SCO1/SenC/PrrC family)